MCAHAFFFTYASKLIKTFLTFPKTITLPAILRIIWPAELLLDMRSTRYVPSWCVRFTTCQVYR